MEATLENGLALQDGWVTAYNVNPATGEFVSETQEYVTAGVGLPAYCMAVAPPAVPTGQVARLKSNGTGWELVQDLRGQTAYNRQTRQAVVIENIGALDKSLTLLEPQTEFDTWQDNGWVTDTAAQKTAQIKEAESLRATKLAEVNAVTQMWQTQLALGMISDASKAKLIKWMTYADQLQEVDTTLAPYVVWPEKPAA